MKLYIDEHYDFKTGRTILAILKMDEKTVANIWKIIKKIIKKNEKSVKSYTLLLTELKSHRLKIKSYWADILSVIYKVMPFHTYAIIPCQPNNKTRFQKAYVDIIVKLLEKEGVEIYADNINNKKFMKPIIDQINDSRFMFCDSEQNKGIQIADLIASTYKGRSVKKDQGIIIGYDAKLNT